MNDKNDKIHEQGHDKRSRGATAVEYALIVALIAGIIIGAVGILGQKTQGLYNDTETEMTNAGM